MHWCVFSRCFRLHSTRQKTEYLQQNVFTQADSLVIGITYRFQAALPSSRSAGRTRLPTPRCLLGQSTWARWCCLYEVAKRKHCLPGQSSSSQSRSALRNFNNITLLLIFIWASRCWSQDLPDLPFSIFFHCFGLLSEATVERVAQDENFPVELSHTWTLFQTQKEHVNDLEESEGMSSYPEVCRTLRGAAVSKWLLPLL